MAPGRAFMSEAETDFGMQWTMATGAGREVVVDAGDRGETTDIGMWTVMVRQSRWGTEHAEGCAHGEDGQGAFHGRTSRFGRWISPCDGNTVIRYRQRD
ncbi:hypothetical protein D5S17_08790 [Pseudonocardiaceae bacterium YIM PH 21723]|nr:hypothetical protein D5S17_08790 [Pseudonocardiaceae bacterium YIM PH 21723]